MSPAMHFRATGAWIVILSQRHDHLPEGRASLSLGEEAQSAIERTRG